MKYAALTVRKLKSGSYDDWRKAWWDDSTDWPEGAGKVFIIRNVNDPDEVIAFGFFEADNLDAMRNDTQFQDEQRQRFEAMAPHVESTGADGIYEVVEELSPPA